MRKIVRLAGITWMGAALLLGAAGAHAQFVPGHQAEIYPEPSGARSEITAALQKARGGV